jgi:hypothetical protein
MRTLVAQIINAGEVNAAESEEVPAVQPGRSPEVRAAVCWIDQAWWKAGNSDAQWIAVFGASGYLDALPVASFRLIKKMSGILAMAGGFIRFDGSLWTLRLSV